MNICLLVCLVAAISVVILFALASKTMTVRLEEIVTTLPSDPKERIAGSPSNILAQGSLGTSCHRFHKGPSMMSAASFELNLVNRLFDLQAPMAGITFGKCQLTASKIYPARQSSNFASVVIGLFEQFTKQVSDVKIDRYNLWHSHLILPNTPSADGAMLERGGSSVDSTVKLLLLFHAFEYPRDGGANLGYCQVGSTISVRNPNFRRRNALCEISIAKDGTTSVVSRGNDEAGITILPCPNDGSIYCTHYGEEFGTEIGELIYPDHSKSELFFCR
jgi:hypothetical protein